MAVAVGMFFLFDTHAPLSSWKELFMLKVKLSMAARIT